MKILMLTWEYPPRIVGGIARVVISWGVLLSPYKTFFTPGFRDGDFIHRIYEYDKKYDEDKFYK